MMDGLEIHDGPSRMNSPSPPADRPSDLGSWLRRKRALLGLLRDTRYRRDLLALLVLGLRAMIGWRLLLGLALLAVAGGWVLSRGEYTARQGYELLQGLFLLAAVAAGSAIYSAEKDQGTFELLWLASGSERGLLRLKLATILVLLGVIQVPAILLVGAFVEGNLAFAPAWFFLISNGFFVLAAMALIGTWLPQAWSAGLAGAGLLGAIYLGWQGATSTLYPFTSPISEPLANAFPGGRGGGMGILVINRVFLIVAGSILLDVAARRLRRAL